MNSVEIHPRRYRADKTSHPNTGYMRSDYIFPLSHACMHAGMFSLCCIFKAGYFSDLRWQARSHTSVIFGSLAQIQRVVKMLSKIGWF